MYALVLLLVTCATAKGEQIISCESEEDINENLTVSMTSSRLDYPACVGKNLTLTCSIYGQALTWFLNGIELHRYDGDAVCGDNKRVEIANQPSSFITYTVLATRTDMGHGFFNCTSILDVTSTNYTMTDTITCSSSGDSANGVNPLGDRYCNYSYNVLVDKPIAPKITAKKIAKGENSTVYNILLDGEDCSENLKQYTVISHSASNCMAGNLSVLPILTQTLVAIENGNECNLSVVVTDKCSENDESELFFVNSTSSTLFTRTTEQLLLLGATITIFI